MNPLQEKYHLALPFKYRLIVAVYAEHIALDCKHWEDKKHAFPSLYPPKSSPLGALDITGSQCLSAESGEQMNLLYKQIRSSESTPGILLRHSFFPFHSHNKTFCCFSDTTPSNTCIIIINTNTNSTHTFINV